MASDRGPHILNIKPASRSCYHRFCYLRFVDFERRRLESSQQCHIFPKVHPLGDRGVFCRPWPARDASTCSPFDSGWHFFGHDVVQALPMPKEHDQGHQCLISPDFFHTHALNIKPASRSCYQKIAWCNKKKRRADTKHRARLPLLLSRFLGCITL